MLYYNLNYKQIYHNATLNDHEEHSGHSWWATVRKANVVKTHQSLRFFG